MTQAGKILAGMVCTKPPTTFITPYLTCVRELSWIGCAMHIDFHTVVQSLKYSNCTVHRASGRRH